MTGCPMVCTSVVGCGTVMKLRYCDCEVLGVLRIRNYLYSEMVGAYRLIHGDGDGEEKVW